MRPTEKDQVDIIVDQWIRQRPDLDPSAMGILSRISRLAPRINDNLAGIFAVHGLDFPGFDVLATLRRSGEPYELTPGQLAASMIVTPGAVAQRLARLEQAGLITRMHDNPDRRKVTVALTPRGLATVDAAVADHCANESNLLALYTDEERALLTDMLRRLLLFLEGNPNSDWPLQE